MRGVYEFDGRPSLGFQSNASSTWQTIGIYELSAESNLFPASDDGLYGLDTVLLDSSLSQMNLTSQLVAGVSTGDVWLGLFGLGTTVANFSKIGRAHV